MVFFNLSVRMIDDANIKQNVFYLQIFLKQILIFFKIIFILFILNTFNKLYYSFLC